MQRQAQRSAIAALAKNQILKDRLVLVGNAFLVPALLLLLLIGPW